MAVDRGSSHGTNEYPFLIGDKGITVLPITSLGLRHTASNERIPTGIPRLDAMLGGKGYYRGSTVLVSGTAGTGKSSIGATFAQAACERGERALYFAFEESQSQIVRNMKSIGIDLENCIEKGLLHFEASRPTVFGLEMHLTTIHKLVETFRPSVVVVDPITNLVTSGTHNEVTSMLTRLIDYLKAEHITALFTSLTKGGSSTEQTEVGISSLMDTWLILTDLDIGGERNRGIMVLKSRGMSHSNQIREFRLTDQGIELEDVYVGPSGVLTGSARAQQEAKERAAEKETRNEIERKRREYERKRAVAEAQIMALRAAMEADQEEMEKIGQQEEQRLTTGKDQQEEMARRRGADEEVAR